MKANLIYTFFLYNKFTNTKNSNIYKMLQSEPNRFTKYIQKLGKQESYLWMMSTWG